tara:strand:+ start:4138 stop:4596 length:459 start_codon:yes stop_codon:yes gene_type:complete
MASGLEHDKAIKIWTVPLGLCISMIFGIDIGVLFSVSFLLGGLWLSPDLDTLSTPLKRWGLLKIIWWPYKKIIKHRSYLSHGILIGTTIRLGYLLGITMLTSYLVSIVTDLHLIISINNLKSIQTLYPEQLLAAFIGIEASAWIHLIKDLKH